MFFRGEREKERGNVHTERRWAHISDTLQARDEARTGVCEGGKKPSIKSDKSKSASSTAALGKRAGRSRQQRGWTAERKEMDISWLSVSEQCFYEWLPSYQSSIIRQLNKCCLQMLNKIKLSHNDLRVRIPLLCITNLLRDWIHSVRSFFFFKWSNLLLSDRCVQAY